MLAAPASPGSPASTPRETASPDAGDGGSPFQRFAWWRHGASRVRHEHGSPPTPGGRHNDIRVDTGSFLAIVGTSAVAATLVAVAGGRGLFIPVVVVELVLGVIIGPQVLDLAHVDAFTHFFAGLGLGMLFFFAGYEIDIARIRGEPLRLALFGWAMSLAIAYTLGGALAAGRCRRLARLRRLRPRDDRHRHAAAGPLGHGRDSHPLRHVPARGGRGRGVRPDPAAHARPVDAERGAQRADPDRLRRPGGGRRAGRGPLVGPHDPGVRADDREELAARGPLDRRARLRAGPARLRPRPRPPARRVRRRADHTAGPPEAGGARPSTRS